MTRISIKNIADSLGISSSTVSFVLNGKDQKVRISKEMAEKVRNKAKELNYTPNMAARSLRTKKTKTIGLIVADISNPFFSKLARHIENIAAKKKYQVIFGSSDESHVKFQNLCEVFIGKSVDGMIVVPPEGGGASLVHLIENKMPLVVIDREAENIPINTVMTDNLKASYALTCNLIKQGCKRIGLVGHNKTFSNVRARYDGYKKALEDNGIAFDQNIALFIEPDNFEENVDNTLSKLLENEIDSIFFITSKVGRQFLYSLKSRGYLEKLNYASIDLFEECKLLNITISSIEQPLDVMSERALDILFKQMEDDKYEIIEYISLHPPQIKLLEKV